MKTTHILLRGAEVFTPESIGKKDVLICGEKILAVEDSLDRYAGLEDVEVIDLTGKKLVPGFIDNHVHILGGGGGGGPVTRGPEIFLSDLARCGTTTVVGLLGIDGMSRSLEGLLAKVRALKEEGMSAYMYVGSYQFPPPTICGSIPHDIMLIPEVLGPGEISVADERGTHITTEEMARIAGETAYAARIAGKRGMLCVHMGSTREAFSPMLEAVERFEVDITRFLPTHINRSRFLLDEGVKFAKKGGYLDFTTAFQTSSGMTSAIEACVAADECRQKGIPVEQLVFSTDGNGVHAFYDERVMDKPRTHVWPVKSLWEQARRLATDHGWTLDEALAPVTSNAARVLGIKKGHIEVRADADMVVLDDDLQIDSVFARGKALVRDREPVIRGWFEKA